MLYRGIDHPTLILARFAWDKNQIEPNPPQWVRDTINDDADHMVCTDKTMLVLQMIASKAGDNAWQLALQEAGIPRVNLDASFRTLDKSQDPKAYAGLPEVRRGPQC
ncbi:MAG: hypothetical protein VX893_09125 [Candidatus Latescibacterota bacterium]|nr:hypothetical protein [Candidatus Latescibacterota bacterium]